LANLKAPNEAKINAVTTMTMVTLDVLKPTVCLMQTKTERIELIEVMISLIAMDATKTTTNVMKPLRSKSESEMSSTDVN
jgi:hypothetical protein